MSPGPILTAIAVTIGFRMPIDPDTGFLFRCSPTPSLEAYGNGITLSPNAFQSNRMLDESRAVAVDRMVVRALSVTDKSTVSESR